MKDNAPTILPLPFKVCLFTKDGEWTHKASFLDERLAGAWVIGLSSQKIQAKIFEDCGSGLQEITERAVQNAADVLKRARGLGPR